MVSYLKLFRVLLLFVEIIFNRMVIVVNFGMNIEVD